MIANISKEGMPLNEYRIIYLDLPCTINGMTVKDSSGFYNIYINAHLCVEAQKKAILHELTHIKRNDFYSLADIQQVENLKN